MQYAPYGLGFSTLNAETRIDDLPVRGTVPPWLQGTLLRTGQVRSGPSAVEPLVRRPRHAPQVRVRWRRLWSSVMRFTVGCGLVMSKT